MFHLIPRRAAGVGQRTRRAIAASDARQPQFLALLKNLDGEIAVHTGEAFQEIIQRLTALEIIEKSLYGDPSPAKNGGSVHHFRVACDCFLHDSIVAQVLPLELTYFNGSNE